MKFFVGLHQPSDAKSFDRAFISVNRVRTRKKAIGAGQWIMDSGAFTEIATHGRYRSSVDDYAAVINRWSAQDPRLIAAVSQDYMCEPVILQKTGMTIDQHQRLTIERYDALRALVRSVYVMPVLQGFDTADYVRHLEDYGDRIPPGAWVGVGSVCKRNTELQTIRLILAAILRCRPDLLLHAFGLKTTALADGTIREMLHTADSMAWSFGARRRGENPNDWRVAQRFLSTIETQPIQLGWAF